MGGKAAWLWLPLLAAVLGLAACEQKPAARHAAPAQQIAAAVPGSEQNSLASAPVIVALGDSLTAGFGLLEEQSFPALLRERLRREGYPYRVVNAGVSGDTSAGGLARMDWLLQHPVVIFIVALGANDGLRGVKPQAIRANLEGIVARARAADARVLLVGMELPSNYGRAYRAEFSGLFPALARRLELAFLPFLLEGVAARRDLNQADGIHPNAQGQAIVAENVWRVLEPMLER
ncbi:MAG: arylesterase [SAR324 cluster bacterium]|nr:arylesterase [SAR324 cluster bacterium]MCZ6628397.1 arylesterase [SAR324 cluster bacterium]MCZ6843410.1 arylesterase [SAR324 cluster bacterium]